VFSTRGLSATTLVYAAVYAASLAKQMTAACAALLVHRGDLDMDAPLSDWLPELPGWARTVRLRHLVHHTAALPDDTELAERETAAPAHLDFTTPSRIAALIQFPALDGVPGTRHAYSNAGYVCLALVVERACGEPLPAFARRHIFVPLGMADTIFWSGPEPVPAQAAPLARIHPAPLSLGDGGMWSTATDLLRWSQAFNADELGISTTLQTPGRLDDGTVLDYAWGLGVRSHAGHRVYSHGGGWPGIRLKLAHVPDLNASVLAVALHDDTDDVVAVVDELLDTATQTPPLPYSPAPPRGRSNLVEARETRARRPGRRHDAAC
jgi:CubicO group peptidase (beta-lactamase class C family)